LTNKENAEKFNFFNLQNIQINTSVNSEKAFLRVSTIHQLLSTYKRNIAYKNDLFPIYELQKIYDFSLESK
jgi:phenylalanyl-tRNA synthetase beta subunit